jgi:response regulator of citrate/malate metabolism
MSILNKIPKEQVKRILIVENDLLLALINKRYCEMLGHIVVASTRDGKSSIEAVKVHQPDVILMDIKIDGPLNGIETMHEIRKFSDVDVIYFTGNSEASVKAKAAETNMIAFYVKPIALEDLKSILSYKKKKRLSRDNNQMLLDFRSKTDQSDK